MPLDISGYDSVLKTPAFELLLDRGKNGFAVLELRSYGEGVLEEKVPLCIGQAEYEFFQPRDDLALNTVAFAPSLGVDGSYWRWTGTEWVLDRPFLLTLAQGGIATPFNSMVLPAIAGFNPYGPGVTPPFPFFSVGRRLHCVIDINRPSGASLTATTDIRIGGVSVFSVPWTAGGAVHAQHIEVDLWVSAGTTVTAIGTVWYVTGAAASTWLQQETAVANLNVSAQNISVGITEVPVTPGRYNLIDFVCEVVA